MGTRRLVELAKECTRLRVLVHVSSAYVNSYLLEAEEKIYDAPCDAEQLISTVDGLNLEQLELMTPTILGKHPNTYTITKHLAEHEVKKAEGLFPCTIVRPSMSKCVFLNEMLTVVTVKMTRSCQIGFSCRSGVKLSFVFKMTFVVFIDNT